MKPTPKSARIRFAWASARVPGTTANLGPGFDALGLALRLYNTARVTPRQDGGVAITSPISEAARPGAEAMFRQAAEGFFGATGSRPFGFDISVAGEVPIARGLGSSVTARLGCLAALNALLGAPLDRSKLLDLTTSLEGHPDNAAPALLGGFTAAGLVAGRVRCQRFTVSPRLQFAVLIPGFEVSTPEARRLVPSQFSKADAVHSLGRAALITGAFAARDYESLRGCFDDRLHQPYREALIPQLMAVIRAGERNGAVGGWLSGSGSTIICAALQNPDRVAAAMRRQLSGQVLVVSADNHGLRVRTGPATA